MIVVYMPIMKVLGKPATTLPIGKAGRVWLVNHDSDANTDDRIEEMINDHGDASDRMVLSSKDGAIGIPDRYVPAELWSTNAIGVVAYEVR